MAKEGGKGDDSKGARDVLGDGRGSTHRAAIWAHLVRTGRTLLMSSGQKGGGRGGGRAVQRESLRPIVGLVSLFVDSAGDCSMFFVRLIVCTAVRGMLNQAGYLEYGGFCIFAVLVFFLFACWCCFALECPTSRSNC